MSKLIDYLIERESTLDRVIKTTSRNHKKVPEGKIRISVSGNRTQYYLQNEETSRTGKYVPQKNIATVRAIAQKEYNKKVLKGALAEKNAIEKFLKRFKSNQIEDIYPKIGKHRQKLITPVYLPDDEFVKQWLSVEYEGRGFSENAPMYENAKHVRMRSKSEVIIANMLDKYNVPYRYEYPITIAGIGKVYPDFMILNVRLRKVIIWEHFGMMDDREYRENKLSEIEKYNLSGYFTGENFIFTMETLKKPLNVSQVELFIKHYCI